MWGVVYRRKVLQPFISENEKLFLAIVEALDFEKSWLVRMLMLELLTFCLKQVQYIGTLLGIKHASNLYL